MTDESPTRIEPCLLGDIPAALADLIADLVATSGALGQRLHPASAASLVDLVRVMNCYYSNLIEGHNTRPREIERALLNQLEQEPARRDLQLEAAAHIRVQREIDRRHAAGRLGEPASLDNLLWLHKSFYDGASPNMLRMVHHEGDFQLVPGQLRHERRQDNVVGRHRPPSSENVESFMHYFERRYRFASLGTAARVISMAAAHHRLNYIHPFVDGNGRVSRLMSHAMGLAAGVGAHGLWSISRGLARGLHDAGEYKRMMDHADSPRQGDLDGRGNLSLRALVDFVSWFCQVGLDQVRFMSTLFDLDHLAQRLREHAWSLTSSEDAARLATEVLRRGEVSRGDAAAITGRSERTARAAVAALLRAELLVSDTPKGPVRLRFSAAHADALFPQLFPAQAGV